MRHSGLLVPTTAGFTAHTDARLMVTRRDPDGTYRAIGYLDRLADGSFEFAYLEMAASSPSFVPLIGFSNVRRRYHRAHLFSAFAERVIGAKRADRPQYLAELNLNEDADSWEILSASGGYREGDTIELIAFPTIDVATGHTEARFLAHVLATAATPRVTASQGYRKTGYCTSSLRLTMWSTRRRSESSITD